MNIKLLHFNTDPGLVIDYENGWDKIVATYPLGKVEFFPYLKSCRGTRYVTKEYREALAEAIDEYVESGNTVSPTRIPATKKNVLFHPEKKIFIDKDQAECYLESIQSYYESLN